MFYKISILILFSIAIGGARSSPLEDSKLKSTVQQYYAAWKAENSATMWDLLSPGVRTHTNVKAYATNLEQFFEDTKLTGFYIKNFTHTKKNVAFVDTSITLLIKSEDERLVKIDRTRWIFDDVEKRWYLDDSPQVLARAGKKPH